MKKNIRQSNIVHEESIDDTIASSSQENDNYFLGISEVSLYLREIGKYPLLTAEEEIELAQKIANGDKLAKEKFINSNLRLVIYIAKMYRNLELDFFDIIQEGNIGLLKAVEAFDYTKGFRFSTYATYWIKQAILKAIYDQKDLIRIPTNVQELIKKYQSIQNDFYKNHRRYATDFEISEEMGISIDEVNEIKSAMFSTISLNTPVSSESDSELWEFIVDTDLTPEEITIKNSQREALETLIDNSNLSEREKLIIRMRFDFEKDKFNSLEHIGKKLGVTRERVRFLEVRAMKKIRVAAIKKYKRSYFM